MTQAAQRPLGVSDQPLWIFGGQGTLRPQLIQWLANFSWQHTHDLSHIKKALLSTTQSFVFVDLVIAPHRMLAQIRFLHEHFSNCVIVAIVDKQQVHWGQEALRQGADLYLNPDVIDQDGLSMVLESCQKQKRKQSLLSSVTDPCTGLINPPLYFDRLEHALKVAVRHQCHTGMLMINILDYSAFVSRHGEVLCDGLLNQVALKLKSHIRNSDSLCRVRDGMFAILLEGLQDEVMVGHIAKNILYGFETPLLFQQQSYLIKIAIGGHLCHRGEQNAETLMKQTKVALQRAIEADNQRIWFYTPDMNFKAMARSNMQQGLQRALDRNEFYLMYQPCHSAKGFMSNGMLPLLRWRHPTAGMVMSDVFMSLLKDSGLILPVGRWQIQTMLRQLADWIGSGHWKMGQKMMLLLCEKQLRDSELIPFLKNELNRNNLGPEHVLVQVSERTAIRNLDALQLLCRELSGLGVSIHLSDFGQQYSSFSYLRQLNIECLCLDQSFFLHMHMDHLDTSIAKVIVDIAHRLGIQILASGADSQFKVDKMQALGCDTLMGDFFTPPLLREEWPQYLRDHS